MFDDQNVARGATLLAGLILLIVLAAVAAMSAGLDGEYRASAVPESTAMRVDVSELLEPAGAVDSSDGIQGATLARSVPSGRTRSTASGRIAPSLHDGAMRRLLGSLGPIGAPMSGCFADDALVTYDLGIAPGVAVLRAAEGKRQQERDPGHRRANGGSLASLVHVASSAGAGAVPREGASKPRAIEQERGATTNQLFSKKYFESPPVRDGEVTPQIARHMAP